MPTFSHRLKARRQEGEGEALLGPGREASLWRRLAVSATRWEPQVDGWVQTGAKGRASDTKNSSQYKGITQEGSGRKLLCPLDGRVIYFRLVMRVFSRSQSAFF